MQEGGPPYWYASHEDDPGSSGPSSSWHPFKSSAPLASLEDDSIFGPARLPRDSPRKERRGARRRRGGAQGCTQAGILQQQRPIRQKRKAERPGDERSAGKVVRHAEGHKVSALFQMVGWGVLDSMAVQIRQGVQISC